MESNQHLKITNFLYCHYTVGAFPGTRYRTRTDKILILSQPCLPLHQASMVTDEVQSRSAFQILVFMYYDLLSYHLLPFTYHLFLAPLTGFKPAIFDLEGRCIFSCATGAFWCPRQELNLQDIGSEPIVSAYCTTRTFGDASGS